jgi:Domain of unknown function (DUF4389)
MTLEIKHQATLSRGELLLRTFFGIIYIYIPHFFLLFFMTIWSMILGFITFWIILFTGKYPKDFFDYQTGLIRWHIRLNARLMNLTDGYPAFGISSTDEAITFDVPYPESQSRGLLLLKAFFGWIFVLIPHGFVLLFLRIAVGFVHFIGWWAVLFTGQMPLSLQNFVVGEMRWSTRVLIYIANMTDDYPPFSMD